MDAMTEDFLQMVEDASKVSWFHRIRLGNGYFTPGIKDLEQELHLFGFPADLSGKTVLDIGCNDGGYALAAVERGAQRVVAIDVVATPGLRFVRQRLPLGQRIEFANLDLLSDAFLELPLFDVTLFMGVLYHLKNPLAGLTRLRRVTGKVALIETLVDERVTDIPVMVFYEGDEIDHNKTNWWGPNLVCLKAMVKVSGFARMEVTHYAIDPATKLGRIALLAYTDDAQSKHFDLDNLRTLNPRWST